MGRLAEIGKADIGAFGKLPMFPFMKFVMPVSSICVCEWNAILYCAGFSLAADAGLAFRDLNRIGRTDGLTNVKMTAALASLLL